MCVQSSSSAIRVNRESPFPYLSAFCLIKLTGVIKGVTIGILREGMENCHAEVKEASIQMANTLEEAGAHVEEVSIPIHLEGKLCIVSM